jgi:hypothetical protein
MLKKSLLATLLSAASTITVASDMDISTLQAQLKAQQIQIDALVAASERPTTSAMSLKQVLVVMVKPITTIMKMPPNNMMPIVLFYM